MTIENYEELERRIAGISRIEIRNNRDLSLDAIKENGKKLWEYTVQSKIMNALHDSDPELQGYFYENREKYCERWLEQLKENISERTR